MSEKLGVNAPSGCMWQVTMRTEEHNTGKIEVRSACCRELLPVEIMRTSETARIAANTAREVGDEAREHVLGVGRMTDAFRALIGIMAPRPIEVEVKKTIAGRLRGLLTGQ